MRPTRRSVSSLACAAVLCACASTPKQAVQLSVTVGRDVEAVHAAHVALVKRYFDRMEADVNAFVDGTYRPYMIGEVYLRGVARGDRTAVDRAESGG
jgi:hypothetical protein